MLPPAAGSAASISSPVTAKLAGQTPAGER